MEKCCLGVPILESIRVCVLVGFSFLFFLCLFISVCYMFEYVYCLHAICLFTCMCMLLRVA